MDHNCTSYTSLFANGIYSIVSIVSVLVGSISFLACTFTVSCIFLFRQYHFFNHRLVLYLAIVAAIFSLAITIQRLDYRQETGTFYTNFCIFSGFLHQVSSWMILDAVTSITLSLIIRAFSRRNPQSFEWMFIIFIFFFPFLFNWIPFIESAYGKSGAWCWIRSRDETMCHAFKFGFLMQLLLWYVPLYTIILVQIVLFAVVAYKLTRYKKYSMIEGYIPYSQTDGQEAIKETVPMLAYPIIYFIINIFPLINRIHGFADPTHPSVALWFLSGIFNPLIGVLMAVAYSLDPQTRHKLNPAHVRAMLVGLCTHRQHSVYDYSIPTDSNTDSLRGDPRQYSGTVNSTAHAQLSHSGHEQHPRQKLSPKREILSK